MFSWKEALLKLYQVVANAIQKKSQKENNNSLQQPFKSD